MAEVLVLVRPVDSERGERWWLHLGLGLLTVICALGAGATLAGVWTPSVELTRYGAVGGSGIVGTVLLIILILWLLGALGHA